MLVLDEFLVKLKFMINHCLCGERLFVLVNYVGSHLEENFAFGTLLKFISDFAEYITIDNQVLQSSFFVVLGYLLLSWFLFGCSDSSKNFILCGLGYVRTFGQVTLLEEVFPKFGPDDCYRSVDMNLTLSMSLHLI